MSMRRFSAVVRLLLALSVLCWGDSLVFAQTPRDVQPVPSAQAPPEEGRKSALERRREAKQRLQEAIEAKKAQRLTAPDKVPPESGRGGAQ